MQTMLPTVNSASLARFVVTVAVSAIVTVIDHTQRVEYVVAYEKAFINPLDV